MSECHFDSTRSQYSILDQSLEIFSVCSKSRNGKYFMRKPIGHFNVIANESVKKRTRDNDQFTGFYSPTQKHEVLRKKSLIDKALSKSPQIKIRQVEEKRIINNQKLDLKADKKDANFRKNQIISPHNSDKTFKKKKQIKDDESHVKFSIKNKENPQLVSSQIDALRTENKVLKQEIANLLQSQGKYQSKIQQLNSLKQQMAQLSLRLHQQKTKNEILQIQIQGFSSQMTSMQSLDTIYAENIRSLADLNVSLKQEVFQLRQKMKYANIEINVLKMKCPEENISKIMEERDNVRQKNRQLRGQVYRLRDKIRGMQLFQLTPQNTEREFYQEDN